jgi:hypothetical protein
VLQTVQFASQILGGPGSGGLFGVDAPSSSGGSSRLSQFSNTPGYLGATQTSVFQSAASSPTSGSDMTARVATYQSSWSSIQSAAKSAESTLADTAKFCRSSGLPGSVEQATAMENAIATEIVPIYTRVATASTTVAAALFMVQKVQSEFNSSTAPGSTYSSDLQTLQLMAPTQNDVANAAQLSQVAQSAIATPAGSFTVTGTSLVDQMNLLSTNALAVKASVCTPPMHNDSF